MADLNRIGWATDLHLDFLSETRRKAFIAELARMELDLLMVSGDTANSDILDDCFHELERRLPYPVCFVLGNHDFYGSSLAEVRQWAETVARISESLYWMPVSGIIELNRTTCLIGHDGWPDGRLGDYASSTVMLNDFFLIKELCDLDQEQRLARLHELGDEAARYVAEWLPRALARYERVIFLTHVPPFREACWYAGKISNDQFLPFFSSGAAGAVMRSVMLAHPNRRLLVLCGHTHGAGVAHILPNLIVLTGGAEYGEPGLQKDWLWAMGGDQGVGAGDC